MASAAFHPFFPSAYKRRVVVRTAGFGPGGGLGSRSSSSSSGRSYASSCRSYPPHFLAASGRSSSPLWADLPLVQEQRVNSELKVLRTQEKAELQDLNDRFVGFIEKVHDLERQNQLLEAELQLLRRRRSDPSGLGALYQNQVQQLQAAVDQARHERQEDQDHLTRLQDALENLHRQYHHQVQGREEAESRLVDARKGAEEAELGRAQLDQRVRNLLDQLDFLRLLFQGEVSELQAQVQNAAQAQVQMAAAKPDLSAALYDIRGQYQELAQQNLRAAEDWFCTKVDAMETGSARDQDEVRTAKDEAAELRRLLKTRTLEIQACGEVNRALEDQVQDLEQKQSQEVYAMHVSPRTRVRFRPGLTPRPPDS